jgi:hypothetical protein
LGNRETAREIVRSRPCIGAGMRYVNIPPMKGSAMLETPRFARVLAIAALMGLALPAAEAQAATTPQSSAQKVPLAQRPLHQRGTEAFGEGDFVLAGDAWSEVLHALPESRGTLPTRMHLVLDAIAAYREAFTKSGDPRHLQAAMTTYYAYFREWKRAYGHPGIPEPVAEVRHRLKSELARAKAVPMAEVVLGMGAVGVAMRSRL